MKKDTHKTKVLFLYDKEQIDTKTVFAFFHEDQDVPGIPELSGCYAHVGQHSVCNTDYANECVIAHSKDYYSLLQELEFIGYDLIVLNEKSFSVIKKENKDMIITLYGKHDLKLVHTYNSIGGTYSGTIVEAYIGTVYGFLKAYPDFLEQFDESDPVKSLKQLGFYQVEPTKIDLLIHS
jgi:hypothetical protein